MCSANTACKSSSANFEVSLITQSELETISEAVTASFAFVINDKNQLLAIRNERGWDTPGGHREGNETPIETAYRETLEESCIEIGDIEPFAIIKNGPTAMLFTIARPITIHDFVQNEADPIFDRAFMSPSIFLTKYSGGDKTAMTTLIQLLADNHSKARS